MLLNGKPYDVGDQGWIEFTVTPSKFHPTAASTDFEVTVRKPDGTTYTVTSPSPALSSTTEIQSIYDAASETWINTTITKWVFEFPDPFDVGSDRKDWVVNGKSTAGVNAAVDTRHQVRHPALP